jgi:hypothetical protein
LSNEQSDAKVISFPRQLRVVPVEEEEAAAPVAVVPAAVDHDGRTYALEALLRQLPPHCIREVEATAPRSGQELWDEVVRRWPGTAAEMVAGAVEIDDYIAT